MTDDRHDPVADEVRRRLAEQARHAPAGDLVAERVIARAEAGARRRSLPSLPWLRLVAAAAAVLAVAGIAVAVTRTGGGDDHRDDAAQSTQVAPPSTLLETPASTSDSPSSSAAPSPMTSDASKISVPTLTGVKVLDITFTGGGNGWGLASADCLQGSGRCTALLRTSDGGAVWQSRPNTPFHVAGVDGCSAPCVTNLRFATDQVGYAFGRDALFMTTDGAGSWQRLDGGADALETLDGNVIRVSSDATDCPPGCNYTVRVADVGSRDWRTVSLPGPAGAGDGVQLARDGDHAYLLVLANPAGGAGRATSTLWTSADDGATWRNRGEQCAADGGENDSRALTTASDGTVFLVCRDRTSGRQAIAVSTDDGSRWTTGPASLGAADVTAFGAASASTMLVGTDDTYRSTDGGRRFTRPDGIGPVAYLGFASDTVAHAIAADGRTIYTSTDAGKTWQGVRFA